MADTKQLVITFDPQSIRRRLEHQLAAVGKTARGASREAGLSDSAIRNIMEGKSRSPRLGTVLRLAQVLDVSPEWFLESVYKTSPEIDINTFLRKALKDAKKITDDPFKNAIKICDPINRNGILELDEKSPAYTLRPEISINISQYLFRINDDSMWPVFRKNDDLFVDPGMSLIEDEDYIFRQEEDFDRVAVVFVGRLISFTDEVLRVKTFNPDTLLELERSLWTKAHRVRGRHPRGSR